MMIANFKIKNKVGRPRFFQKIFLVANIKFEIILSIFFLKLSNVDMLFGKKTLMWETYSTNKILFIIKQV